MDHAEVRWLSAVLSDQPGFSHLQGIREQRSHDASQATGHDGPPLGDAAHFIHVKVDYPGNISQTKSPHIFLNHINLDFETEIKLYSIN